MAAKKKTAKKKPSAKKARRKKSSAVATAKRRPQAAKRAKKKVTRAKNPRRAAKPAKAKAKSGPAPRARRQSSTPSAQGRKAIRRRDRTGHIDPKYAAELRALSGRSDDRDNRAFFMKPRARDDLAEQLAEEFVEAATTGEDESEEMLNQDVPEDRGGPFIVTPAGTEFAYDTDASNPEDATREPFPKA